MAEILIAPRAVNAATQVSGRGNDPRASNAAKADKESGVATPFADVLKSRSEKAQAESSSENPSAADSQPTPDAAASAATLPPAIGPSALPGLLEVDSSFAVHLAQAVAADVVTAAPVATPASRDETDPLTLVVTSTLLPVLTAAPVNPASAVAPAPTFPISEARGTARNVSEPHVAPFAGFASERRSAADKIALETAITAESGKTGTVTAALDPGEGEFRAIMDRVASNPVSVSVLMQTTGPSVAAVPAPDLRMETPLAHANWRDELGQKLTWMVSSNRQQAELVLNPPQLGRIDVTLTLDGDRASVSFASPHAAVREILENSITRLREVLADAGVTLGQTHVGGDSRHDSNSMHRKNGSLAFGHGTSASHVATVEVPGSESAWRFTAGRGLVDVFA